MNEDERLLLCFAGEAARGELNGELRGDASGDEGGDGVTPVGVVGFGMLSAELESAVNTRGGGNTREEEELGKCCTISTGSAEVGDRGGELGGERGGDRGGERAAGLEDDAAGVADAGDAADEEEEASSSRAARGRLRRALITGSRGFTECTSPTDLERARVGLAGRGELAGDATGDAVGDGSGELLGEVLADLVLDPRSVPQEFFFRDSVGLIPPSFFFPSSAPLRALKLLLTTARAPSSRIIFANSSLKLL